MTRLSDSEWPSPKTALYVGGFRLPPMVDDLTVGINEELHHVVSLPFSATLLQPYLYYIDSVTIPLAVAKNNGDACLFNNAPDAIHLGRFSGHGVIHVDNVVVFALDS